MALNHLTKEKCVRLGAGSPEKILLAALRTGLGTSIHALPALAQMIEDGFDITVNCQEFQRPIYEAIGCKAITIREPFGPSWFKEHGHEYGKIISLATWDQWQQWVSGENTTSTMEAFAEILGTKLPDEFSWLEALEPEHGEHDYILFAPVATERWRTIPKDVADKIEEELKDFGSVVRLTGEERWQWHELRDLIANASYVVAVEGGILNVAGALEKKMLAIIGMTEIETTIEQYRKYIPDLEYRVVQGYQPNGCSMPCMRQKERGFFNDRCLGKNNLPECLSKLNVSKVIQEFSYLLGSQEDVVNIQWLH